LVGGGRGGRCRVGELVGGGRGGRCRVGELGCRVGELGCRVGRLGCRVGHLGVRPPGSLCGGPLHPCARLRASELICSETHTNEFCGIEKSTPEPAGPCKALRPGRWVYEKGAARAARAARAASNGTQGTGWLPRPWQACAALPLVSRVRCTFVRGCGPASPFLAKPIQMSFAGLRNPPQSPPARAPHCALVGGYMRREARKQESPAGGMSSASVPRHPSAAAFAGR
jgi:hypothetical protein